MQLSPDSVNPFFARFGFTADPFESTNAEQEPLLGAYFVPPPYFATVMGDPSEPKSNIILAPRGSGKTAQRRMVEERAADGSYLCITYDTFDQPPGFSVRNASLAYHLNQICRLILVGVLFRVQEDPNYQADRLTTHQKQILKAQIPRFLGTLSASEFAQALEAIKTYGERAKAAWDRFGGPIAALLRVVSKKLGLDPIEVPPQTAEEVKRDDALGYHFRAMLDIAKALGFRSTYVLIDKVDESALTNDVPSTFDLIKPLLLDLQTLESEGVAFKFFLWDRIGELYTPIGRPDRVPIHHLEWDVSELDQMLSQRISAYSIGPDKSSFNDLLHPNMDLDVHKLVCYLAQGSPRDMIRLAKRITDEQTRTTPDAVYVEEAAVWEGVGKFSATRAAELFSSILLTDLRRIARPSFTVDQIGRAYFPGGHNARRRLKDWLAAGIIESIAEIVDHRKKRASTVYAICDLRVLIAALSTMDPRAVLDNHTAHCPKCHRLHITAEDAVDCQCGEEFLVAQAKTLLEVCTIRHDGEDR